MLSMAVLSWGMSIPRSSRCIVVFSLGVVDPASTPARRAMAPRPWNTPPAAAPAPVSEWQDDDDTDYDDREDDDGDDDDDDWDDDGDDDD